MMNLCHQLNVYGMQIATLLSIVFTMIAFSQIGKKGRSDSAYITFVGMSLMCLVNICCGVMLGHLSDSLSAITGHNVFVDAIQGGVVAAVIITALLMIVGKPLKVKAMLPKTLFLCFFVGIALSNLVGVVVDQQCAASVKTEKSRG